MGVTGGMGGTVDVGAIGGFGIKNFFPNMRNKIKNKTITSEII